MASSDIYVAKESFATTLDGQPVIVQKDVTRVRAGHPLLKGKEALFELLTVQYDVEQATARPGERRGEPKPEPEPAPEPAQEPEAAPEPEAASEPEPEARAESSAERRARIKAEAQSGE